MNHEILNKKVTDFCSFLKITEDAFNIRGIKDDRDFIDQIVSLFKDNHRIFNAFLYKIFDLRVRHALLESYEEEGFKDDQPIEDILPLGLVESRLKHLESEVKLIFPRPVLSKFNLSIQLVLFLLPALLFVLALVLHVEFLVVLYGMIKFGVIVILLFLPNVIGYFLFPKVYKPSKLVGISTYHDLIEDLVLMNRHYYVEDDFKNASEELKNFIGSL